LLVGLDVLDVTGDPRFDGFGRESLGRGRIAHEVKAGWEEALAAKTAAEILELVVRALRRDAPIN
jgi:hypothetical protein